MHLMSQCLTCSMLCSSMCYMLHIQPWSCWLSALAVFTFDKGLRAVHTRLCQRYGIVRYSSAIVRSLVVCMLNTLGVCSTSYILGVTWIGEVPPWNSASRLIGWITAKRCKIDVVGMVGGIWQRSRFDCDFQIWVYVLKCLVSSCAAIEGD